MTKRKIGSIEYSLVRTNSKNRMTLRVTDAGVKVCAPNFVPASETDAFVSANLDFISRRLSEARSAPERSLEAERALRERILSGIARFAPRLGAARPARVSVREARTRWGSCSRTGNLNFSNRLAYVCDEALDYVVLHELCHLYEFNHSPKFWNLVKTHMPDFEARKLRLKQNSQNL